MKDQWTAMREKQRKRTESKIHSVDYGRKPFSRTGCIVIQWFPRIIFTGLIPLMTSN